VTTPLSPELPGARRVRFGDNAEQGETRMTANDDFVPSIPSDVIDALERAKRVVAFTGAGISQESGVPTFRDAQSGLWARFSPEELATPEAFRKNPAQVWEWYAYRRGLVARAEPNPGHRALVELARRVPELTLITQNVDGLHQRAGSHDVVELHGNIATTKCFDEDSIVSEYAETGAVPPRCPRCGGLLRPGVVWFHESLPAAALERAMESTRRAEVFFSIGTSTVVYPAAELPFIARDHGAFVVEINPEATPLSVHAHHSLRGASGAILPAIVRALAARAPS